LSQDLCLAFIRDLQQCDVEAIRHWFTEKSILCMPPMPEIHGQRRILATFRIIFRKYSEIYWKVSDVYSAQNGRYIFATDSWGTIGKSTPYKNSILTIVDFDAEGHILFLSDYFKDTAIFNVTDPARAIPAVIV
jgi:limonene-1,2-epoxide hydrolase